MIDSGQLFLTRGRLDSLYKLQQHRLLQKHLKNQLNLQITVELKFQTDLLVKRSFLWKTTLKAVEWTAFKQNRLKPINERVRF